MADLIPGILDEAAQKRTWKLDPLMAEFAWEPDRENRLVERVAESRAAGVSYGQWMEKLYEEEMNKNGERNSVSGNRQ